MTEAGKRDELSWKCSGCGVESPNRIRKCNCTTECLYRGDRNAGTYQTQVKFNGCVNHPDRKPRENLDGDDLCLECCIAWAKAEGEKS